jgi:hypothetical protein
MLHRLERLEKAKTNQRVIKISGGLTEADRREFFRLRALREATDLCAHAIEEMGRLDPQAYRRAF